MKKEEVVEPNNWYERNNVMSYERKRGQFDVIGWLLRQNEYAKFAERNKISIRVNAGEIYEVDFGINVNAEFSYRHYALALTNSSESNPLVLMCPLKSNNKGAHPSSDINLGIIEALDTDHESLAVINQIRSVDKLRIFRKPVINKRNKYGRGLNDIGSSYYDDEILGIDDIYRLDYDRFMKVKKAALLYLEYGFLPDSSKND